MNKVILRGNLVAAPEARQVGKNNTPFAKFRIGVNEGKRAKPVFVDVETWETTAEVCEKYLNKGSPVLIEGRLALDEWEDKTTKKNRSRVFVVAHAVEFLGKTSGEDDAPAENTQSDTSVADDDDVPF
jgi:single-strand DNA-binding protein